MKKSLIIVGFAFIFLLTMSVVSAGLFINGDVVSRQTSGGNLPTSIEGKTDNTTPTSTTFSRTSASGRSERVGQSQRIQGMGSSCPRGFLTLSAKDGGNCCQKATAEQRKAGAGAIRDLLQRRMGNSDIVSGYPPCTVGGARPCRVRDGTILS